MPRKGENICKRKDGRWEARYIAGRKENGKAIYKSVYGHSYKEVKEKRTRILEERAKFPDNKKVKTDTIEAVAKDWIQCNTYKWKESTKCRYIEKLNTYIIPKFGNRSLSDISTKEIEDFILTLQKEGYEGRRPLGSSSVSMVLTILKQLQFHAKKTDCFVRFSAECIVIRKNKPRHEVLTPKEEKILIKKLKDNLNEINTGILTSLFTGIRIGEICALRCDNIDLANGILHIRETMQRLPDYSSSNKKTLVQIDIPKSDCSNRDIPINKNLLKLLRPFIKPGAFLLTGDKKRFVEPRTMENHFSLILEQCNIKHFGYHVTRRTFATRCIERGMNPKTLSEILGHSNIATTLDYYVVADMKKKAEGLELLSDLLNL
ncbi:tyrosine-type recombinase/integrase [Butyrivibrio sp. NC3005]|uniref:tyrosine-type recombinase/integrase n=1 Tax=Butyrivibrio sp. NC3005 TaxID=1280685 RepID=UPI00040FA710|nr:site-specific integrase [Butyrivibrio sp. NC3005]